jgi:chromosome segregation protein
LAATGVEIEAQPLGKKLTSMTLLSGGERSLAAIAFLFAIFDSRPSPFYVLDEVEAALDDTNLHRFIRLLDEFRSKAQMLVITHQQQTMEAGDVLYGVTMEPGGSSTVVAKSMTQVSPNLDQMAGQ